MNIIRALFISFVCLWCGTQVAQDTFNDIKQMKQLLEKSEITPDDKSTGFNLLLALSSKKNDRNAVVAAEQLSPRWKIKLLGQSCNKFDDLIPIIGQENYEQAIQGKNIDPMKLGEGSRRIVEELEQKAAGLEKIVSALEVETIDSAKKTISAYKKLQESPRDAKALDTEITALNASIAQLKQDLATKRQELAVKEENLKQLKAQQNAPTRTCDAMAITRTQSYKAALGAKNFERLQHAVDQKIKNPALAQEDLSELIKLEDFPSNSAIVKERQLIEQEIQETRKKLTAVRQELSTLGKTPAPPTSKPVAPQNQPQPATPIPPAPPVPGPVTPQNQPELVTPTPTTVSDDCEKKLIKIRMALNIWSDPDGWLAYGAWYDDYLEPTVKNKELSEKIKKEIGFKPAELDKLSDCEKTVATIQLVQKRYEDEKKIAAENNQTGYNAWMEGYIGPILKDAEWNQNKGISSVLGGTSDYEKIKDYNRKALSDPRKNTFGITKEEFEAIFGKQ